MKKDDKKRLEEIAEFYKNLDELNTKEFDKKLREEIFDLKFELIEIKKKLNNTVNTKNNNKKYFHIYLDVELHEHLKKDAQKDNVTIAARLDEILRKYYKLNKKEVVKNEKK